MSCTMPMPYPGTESEIDDNLRSHSWAGERCDRCGCKTGHITAGWPCGATPDRVTFERSPWGLR